MRKYADSVSSAINGLPVYRAQIRLQHADTTEATIYSDEGITAITQPLLTNGLGEYSFYVPDGTYTLIVAAPDGSNPISFPNTEIYEDARNVSVPVGETGITLPAIANRANKLLSFDVNGTPVSIDQFAGVNPSADVIQEAMYRANADSALDARVLAIESATADLPSRYDKLNDTTIQSDATLNADSELSVPLAANSLAIITGKIYYTTTAAADFKWRHTGPASPTRVRVKRQAILPGDTTETGIAVDTAYSASDIVMAGGTGSGIIEIDALVRNGSTAGQFGISWSQNTSDASNTTVEMGSYLEVTAVPAALDIVFSSTSIAKLGGFNASSSGGHNFYAVSDPGYGNSHIETMVTATDVSAQLFGGNYTLSIDGGSTSPITAPAGWSFINLYEGLSDAPHRVSLTGTYFEADIMMRATGSAPAFARPADIPTFYAIGDPAYTPYIAAEGVAVSNAFSTLANQKWWSQPSGAGLRFRATTTSVRVWLDEYIGPTTLVLLQDGTPVGSPVVTGVSGIYQKITLATGLSGTHDYEIIPISIGHLCLIYGLMVDALVATAQAPKAVDAYYGDSIIQGNVLVNNGVTDARLMAPYIMAQATGRVSTRVGGSGAKMSIYGRDNTASITGLASTPSRVFVCFGVNDMAQSVSVSNYQADWQTCLTALRAGLPSAKIYARGILPVGTGITNYAARPTYNTAAAAAVTAMADANIVYVNTDGWINPTTDTYEGLHPNPAGEAKIAAAQQLVL